MSIHFPSLAALFGAAAGASLVTAANWWVKVIQAPSSSQRLLLLIAAGMWTIVAIGFMVGLCLSF